jgi:hypothetical protein
MRYDDGEDFVPRERPTDSAEHDEDCECPGCRPDLHDPAEIDAEKSVL